MDLLTPVAKHHMEQLGSPCTRASEVIESKDPRVYLAIQDGIKRANQQAVSNAQRVRLIIKATKQSSFFLYSPFRFKSTPSFPKTFQLLEES